MYKMKIIYITALFLLFSAFSVCAQQTVNVSGKVMDAKNGGVLRDVAVSSPGAGVSAQTDTNGVFTIEVRDKNATLKVFTSGYHTKEIKLNGRTNVSVYLQPENTVRYNGNRDNSPSNSVTINKKDLLNSYSSPEDALTGMVAGLNITNKSGMPGEGSRIQWRGIRSFNGENTPLIVVDGLPYLPDQHESSVINGYSSNIFMPVNLKEVENITILKGSDAMTYGSLGSNGVLLIETEKAVDLETKVEFQTVNGLSWMNKRIPLMDSRAFKSYIGDVGETAISDLNALVERFPFLKNDPASHTNYLYDNETDWQEEVYTPAFSTENILKIKGGDAIANYSISVGYLGNKGIVENTNLSKYFTRLNANIAINQKLKMFASAGFTFNDSKLMEQGMVNASNPLLASLKRAPLLSVYEKNGAGDFLPRFESIRQFGISNPAAIVSDVEAKSKAYNVLVNAGLNYSLTPKLIFSAQVGAYYNYKSENLFIPGMDNNTIAPQDGALNTSRSGIGENFDLYLKADARYKETFRYVHNLEVAVGYQMMVTNLEYDNGMALNTKSDFFKTLGNVQNKNDWNITGYINQWNWMNYYFKANYDYKGILFAGATATIDGSSLSGVNSGFFRVFPGVNAGWRLKNMPFLNNVDGIDELSVRAEYTQTGNSRFPSKLGKYYYENKRYRTLSGSVRGGIPNSQLCPEKNQYAAVGLDFATLGHKLYLHVEAYDERNKNMIMAREIASVYGFGSMYDNAGEIKTQGVELSLQATLLNTRNWEWVAGGNIAFARSEIVSLGGVDEIVSEFADGSALLSKVGESPYAFYGYRMEGVIASYADADALALYGHNGRRFDAGDVRFRDLDGNKKITPEDREVLGNATPDFQGGFFTSLRYKNISLAANFTYSYGNEAYNAVRRESESVGDYGNKSRAVEGRWMSNGQITNMPRADYKQMAGNDRFSSRWIEDASYLKLKNVTLTYQLPENLWFFKKASVYLSGDNLFTATKYLGFDPEFAYSYDLMQSGFDLGKIPLAKNVKLGLILQF